jgi:hypothetical protein
MKPSCLKQITNNEADLCYLEFSSNAFRKGKLVVCNVRGLYPIWLP